MNIKIKSHWNSCELKASEFHITQIRSSLKKLKIINNILKLNVGMQSFVTKKNVSIFIFSYVNVSKKF